MLMWRSMVQSALLLHLFSGFIKVPEILNKLSCNQLISVRQKSVKLSSIFFCKLTNKSTSVLLTQYCAGDKIEKNEMGGTCGTYGGRERCAQGFGRET